MTESDSESDSKKYLNEVLNRYLTYIYRMHGQRISGFLCIFMRVDLSGDWYVSDFVLCSGGWWHAEFYTEYDKRGNHTNHGW